jgi:phosphomannomutase
MRAAGAVIGGEGTNGGIIFPAVHYCRDSYMGMAFLLDRMAETGSTLSELAGMLPSYYRRIDKFDYEHGRLGPIMQELETLFPGSQVDRSDGLKLITPDGWLHVRASNTEPVLRLAAEARSAHRLEEIYSKAARVVERH